MHMNAHVFYSFQQGLPLYLELSDSVRQASQGAPWIIPYLHLPVLGLQILAFYVGFEGMNSGPHACKAIT